MKNKNIIIGAGVLLVIIFGFMMLRGCLNQVASTIKPAQKAEAKYWTCGMHPSVRVTDEEYKQGKKNCPICGMNLIPAPGDAGEPKKEEHVYYGCGVKEEGHCPHCDEGKPDAACICGGHSVMIEGVSMKCPACGRPLKKLTPEEAQRIDTSIVSRVKFNKEMADRAGIIVEPSQKYHLTKTIRAVGKIAFDPELSVAEEEFLTALETREKVSNSKDEFVLRRAEDIVGKSKIRLKLLGLDDAEIKRLEGSRTAQEGLILPADKAWVYADIYEYDIGWVKEGQEVKVTAVAFPGEEFKGVIRSLASVLDPKTRSMKARIEVDNPEKKLKPEMYVDTIIESMYMAPDGSREVLALPKEAILDTGTRKLVYVSAGEGEYLGKVVKVGPEGVAVGAEGKELRLYPILSGIGEGELFVRKGNFLIDSQSQLTGGMSTLWGAAQEIKSETPAPSQEASAGAVETKHKH